MQNDKFSIVVSNFLFFINIILQIDVVVYTRDYNIWAVILFGAKYIW